MDSIAQCVPPSLSKPLLQPIQKNYLIYHSQGFRQSAAKETIIPGSKYSLKQTNKKNSSNSDATDKLIKKISAKKKMQKIMYFIQHLAHYKHS